MRIDRDKITDYREAVKSYSSWKILNHSRRRLSWNCGRIPRTVFIRIFPFSAKISISLHDFRAGATREIWPCKVIKTELSKYLVLLKSRNNLQWGTYDVYVSKDKYFQLMYLDGAMRLNVFFICYS